MAKHSNSMTPANDNSKLQVVWSENPKRNYVMTRYETEHPPGTVTVGIVDLGQKDGLWYGYAKLDEKTGKFMFTKARELIRDTQERA